ncbi:MAG TPA: molecular chaperone HtpG [Candidatus Cloacimonetes bacterium]|nr:molecular chaperone HtpG [Candidatus Cloacimonadota bacterium]
MAKKNAQETGSFSIHTENIFPIIKKWLYSQHDIFLRELVSNSVDAISKRSYADDGFKEEDMKIEIKLDKSKKTLEIHDTGIGMTSDEIKKYINQIAFSGAEEFVNKFKDVQTNIIGHFGLGFYSSFMVAEKVTIDSLSYTEGAKPAYWECDGSTEYLMKEGKRKEVGTTITLHFNKESEEYADSDKIREILLRYSNFLPIPIMFEDKQINQLEALWNRAPKDVTDEEYIKFYKEVFGDHRDPVFWIHLNVDFPFNLKGILYFPQLRNEPEFFKGQVKLFCNNVFVADNLEELIPEFLLLLKGGIDIPDIPLNVSRSFLQNDAQVQKISRYIIKKVADHLKDTFKEDRKKYEEYWEDIHTFIKFGMLKEEDFFEAMHEHVLFKSASGDYLTIEEYKTRNAADDEGKTRIWYAAGEDTQVSYLNLMKEQGLEVIYQNSPLDVHLYQRLEGKLEKTEFIRVDSEVNELLVDEDQSKLDKDDVNRLKKLFYRALDQKVEASFSEESWKEFLKKHPQATEALTPHQIQEGETTRFDLLGLPTEVEETLGEEAMKELNSHAYTEVTVELKSLKSKEIPGMIVFSEFMRRWHDMDMMNTFGGGMDMLKNHSLVINTENPIIQKLVELDKAGEDEKVQTISSYIHRLSLLEQKPFTGEELKDFIAKANKVLSYL